MMSKQLKFKSKQTFAFLFSSFVTLHGKTGIKVIARSQHANTTCLVCSKTRFMRIFNLKNNEEHTTLCWEDVSTLNLLF